VAHNGGHPFELLSWVELGDGLLQINDVNTVSFGENVGFHSRIPPAGLMPKMNPGFKKLLHGNDCQGFAPPDCLNWAFP
jgi:hypothetical protein